MSYEPTALVITVDTKEHCRSEVQINGVPIGFTPYSGSTREQVVEEVCTELAGLLRERLGYTETDGTDW